MTLALSLRGAGIKPTFLISFLTPWAFLVIKLKTSGLRNQMSSGPQLGNRVTG